MNEAQIDGTEESGRSRGRAGIPFRKLTTIGMGWAENTCSVQSSASSQQVAGPQVEHASALFWLARRAA